MHKRGWWRETMGGPPRSLLAPARRATHPNRIPRPAERSFSPRRPTPCLDNCCRPISQQRYSAEGRFLAVRLCSWWPPQRFLNTGTTASRRTNLAAAGGGTAQQCPLYFPSLAGTLLLFAENSRIGRQNGPDPRDSVEYK